jgi:hypothetical protein
LLLVLIFRNGPWLRLWLLPFVPFRMLWHLVWQGLAVRVVDDIQSDGRFICGQAI